MKKFTKIFLISLLFITILGACTSAKPEDTVTEFLDTIKNTDDGLFDESLKDYWVSDSSNMDTVEELNSDDDAYTELYLQYMQDFDYTILDSTVTDDLAVVSVEFTTYPIAEMFMAWMMQMFTNLFDPTISGLSEEELNQKYIEWFNEVAQNYSKNRVSTADIHLIKIEGDWKFSADDENIDFVDALFGGLLSGFDGDLIEES